MWENPNEILCEPPVNRLTAGAVFGKPPEVEEVIFPRLSKGTDMSKILAALIAAAFAVGAYAQDKKAAAPAPAASAAKKAEPKKDAPKAEAKKEEKKK